MSSNTGASLITIILSIVVIITLIFGVNACSAPKWNDGVCPDCHVRYELRGVSKHLKYYVCPECGQEVERY
jgi:PHP family Zn ribbon phosphoesterase